MIFSDQVYNAIKWIVCVVIPAAIVCFNTIAGAWGMDAELVKAITVTISAIEGVLGVIFGIECVYYNSYVEDGKIDGSEE